ncbi:MAG: hypothetical protein H5T99_06715 [Moorella sp. (in: Bacteria)]|nr:hypothetical protein [Moorella sp. (in: firmicutes)]
MEIIIQYKSRYKYFIKHHLICKVILLLNPRFFRRGTGNPQRALTVSEKGKNGGGLADPAWNWRGQIRRDFRLRPHNFDLQRSVLP